MKTQRSRAPVQEEGATAVVVVLSLFALFGMIVLVVDVGGLLYARRGMVNASDAAALAAAQSCIGVGESEEAFADQFAAYNADGVFSGGSNITAVENCHEGQPGYVSVEYSRAWPLFFSGVLGVEGDGQVTTAATAHWGPTGIASPIPLVIYETALQGICDVPRVEEGTTCYIWEDNDIGVGGGDFGFLDVGEGWNVAKGARCNNTGGTNQLADWISGEGVEPLGLNYENATWVCTREMEGGNNTAWRALENLIGQTRDFPIVGTTPGDGEPSFIENPQSKYNVIGFAHFEIVSVSMASKDTLTCPVPVDATLPFDLMTECGASGTYIEGSAKGVPPSAKLTVDTDGVITAWSKQPSWVTFETTDSSDCGGNPAPNASAHCLVLRWHGATIGGGCNPGGGANFGMHDVALCDREFGSCVEPG